MNLQNLKNESLAIRDVLRRAAVDAAGAAKPKPATRSRAGQSVRIEVRKLPPG
jgi:hypothetical protein